MRVIEKLDIEKISLVKNPATGITFTVFKSMDGNGNGEVSDELKSEIEKFFSGDEGTALLKSAAELDAEAQKALQKALELLNKYKEDFPGDVLAAIKALAKYAPAAAADYGKYPAKKSLRRGSIFEMIRKAAYPEEPQEELSSWDKLALTLLAPSIQKNQLQKELEDHVPISKQLEEFPEEDIDELEKYLDDEDVPAREKVEKLMKKFPDYDPWPSLNF